MRNSRRLTGGHAGGSTDRVGRQSWTNIYYLSGQIQTGKVQAVWGRTWVVWMPEIPHDGSRRALGHSEKDRHLFLFEWIKSSNGVPKGDQMHKGRMKRHSSSVIAHWKRISSSSCKGKKVLMWGRDSLLSLHDLTSLYGHDGISLHQRS